MSQNNEQVFFNESDIYISQFRFVTSDGRTFPTRTLQSTFLTLVRPWGCLSQMSALFFALLGIVAAFPFIFGTLGLILWYAVEDSRGQFLFDDVGITWSMAILSTLTLMICILGLKITAARRRRQWTANFMFAGGGDFSTVGGGTIGGTGIDIGGATVFGGGVSVSSSTTRRPDYSVWSYDRQWTESLIAAANEAMVAAQQPQG